MGVGVGDLDRREELRVEKRGDERRREEKRGGECMQDNINHIYAAVLHCTV